MFLEQSVAEKAFAVVVGKACTTWQKLDQGNPNTMDSVNITQGASMPDPKEASMVNSMTRKDDSQTRDAYVSQQSALT